MVLVSSCLLGKPCRYNGECKTDKALLEELAGIAYLPVCPEILGGLSIPRMPSEIAGGDGEAVLEGRARVYTLDGEDVTEAFLRGAYETLRLCRMYQAEKAILQARSPSCGCGEIYDGSFSGIKIQGDGVTAALLRRNGISLVRR